MTRYININGVRRKMTADEEAKFELDIQATNEYKQSKQQADTDKETKKASGKQKLLDLGLTEEEVKALIGVWFMKMIFQLRNSLFENQTIALIGV